MRREQYTGARQIFAHTDTRQRLRENAEDATSLPGWRFTMPCYNDRMRLARCHGLAPLKVHARC
jgi:hypothetical protein